MEPNEGQPQSGGETAGRGWIRIERLIGILFFAVMAAAIAGRTPSGTFKLELQFPDGGSEMHLLSVGKTVTSGHPDVRAGTGPEGPWSEEHFVVTEFEVLSIGQNSVSMRLRLKRFDRTLNAEQARHILEADKVAWHRISYFPGRRVSIPVDNGQPVLLSGSVDYW